MGCCASKKPAALGEDGSTPEERLERRRSTKQKLGTVVNPRVEADDDQLAKLGLALNDELEEGKPLTEQEETKLKDEIVAKLEDPTVMESFDETSRVRIFRGMITNNNGTDEENVQEAIETYGTVGKWLREHPSILSEKLPKEELLNGVMNARVGGVDFQGHLVWCEQLGDIAGVVKKGLTVDEAKVLRMKTLEAIRAAQIRACETRGPRRYKNVYVMDLSKLSTMSMSSSSVRDMAKAIVRISASRRFAAVSLHSDASFPGIMAVGRFFSDFECFRTASRAVPERTGEFSITGPARGRHRSDAVARLLASRRRRWCVLGRLSGPRAAAPSVRGARTPCGAVRRPPRRRGDVGTTAWRWGQPARPRHRREMSSWRIVGCTRRTD